MKKNFAMRIAACLLMVTMLSLCMVSYTYAKYTTAGSKADIAQVAKWGVYVTNEFSDLFEEGYNTANATTEDTATATTLTSVAEINMLAPGTSDSQINALTIVGTPEVAVSVQYDIDVQLNNWVIDYNDVNDEEYCPLVIVVTIDGVPTEFKQTGTVAELEEAIEDHINDLDEDRYNPNTNLAKTISFSWSWAFEVDQLTNVKDTALGNNAADGTPATFYISLGVTVTQID